MWPQMLPIVLHCPGNHCRNYKVYSLSLRWCQNQHDGISDHQPHHCLLNYLFRYRSKNISKLHVTGLCEGNSPVTSEFPAQRASNVGNVSIWWCHHVILSNQDIWPIHFIYKDHIFNRVAVPWQEQQVIRIIILAMATRWSIIVNL